MVSSLEWRERMRLAQTLTDVDRNCRAQEKGQLGCWLGREGGGCAPEIRFARMAL